MKLKVAILHKDQQIKTRNYRVWITKHTVQVKGNTFSLKRLSMTFLAPQPEQDVLLLDNKYVLYLNNCITPLDRNWEAALIPPGLLHATVDNNLMAVMSQELYSLKGCLLLMLKSWCRKLTFRAKPPPLVGTHFEDARYYHALDSGMLGLQPTTVSEARKLGLTACPYCLSNELPRRKHE